MLSPKIRTGLFATALCAIAGAAAHAQEASDSLKVFFASGSARVASEQAVVLDQAARLFRDGNPFVMIVSGAADTVGQPKANLALSVSRAEAVANGLAARGIPVERLQVLGRGTSELPVATEADVPEPKNRVVEITWR